MVEYNNFNFIYYRNVDNIMSEVLLNLTDRMSRYRQNKSIEELKRKAKKARRKNFFTQEDIDLAIAEGRKNFNNYFKV